MEFKKGTAAKNIGPCGELLGKVSFYFVFVSTPKHPWKEKDITNFYAYYYKAEENIMRWAKHYEVPLKLDSGYFSCKSPYEYNSNDKWLDHVLTKFFELDEPDLNSLYEHFAKMYHLDSTPFLFVFNSKGRAYAYATDTDCEDFLHERAIIYNDKDYIIENVIVHETLHLFGAIDFYYPDFLKKQAKTYYPKSVMLANENSEIDPLTAYLIGWKKTPDYITNYFLKLIEESDDIVPTTTDN